MLAKSADLLKQCLDLFEYFIAIIDGQVIAVVAPRCASVNLYEVCRWDFGSVPEADSVREDAIAEGLLSDNSGKNDRGMPS